MPTGRDAGFKSLMLAAKAMGYDSCNLVLSFESRENVGAGPAPQPQTTFRLRDREGRLSVHEQRSVPKLIETPRERTQIYHPNRFRIDATIDDKENGTRLWQGWAVADTGDRTPTALAKAMVPAIVGGIGRTERQKPFALK